MVEKSTHLDSFKENIEKCIELSERRAGKELPKKVKCLLGLPEQYENTLVDGYLKYLGGRKLSPDQLINVPVHVAAKFTFVDGKVPSWINLYYEGYDEESSYIRILTSKTLSGDVSKLYKMPEGGTQFRILLSGLGVSGSGLPENLELLPND